MKTWRALTPSLDLWPLILGLTTWTAIVGAVMGLVGYFAIGFYLS